MRYFYQGLERKEVDFMRTIKKNESTIPTIKTKKELLHTLKFQWNQGE